MSPKVAQIGLGPWGRNLLRCAQRLGALGAVLGRHEAARAELATLCPGVPVDSTVAQLLARPAISGVLIATPTDSHVELARAALAAGKDVFVEKPLCLEPEEGAALARQAQAVGRILMVGHVLWYHPVVEELARQLASGVIGPLRYLQARRQSLGKLRPREDVLWCLGPHDVSLFLGLTGGLPHTVSAHATSLLRPDYPDAVNCHFQFAGGRHADLQLSWLHPRKEQVLTLVGDHGSLVFDDTAAASDKLTLHRHTISWDDQDPSVARGASETLPVLATEPLLAEVQHFLDCIATRQPPRTDAWEAVRGLQVLTAAARSWRHGGRPESLHPLAEPAP